MRRLALIASLALLVSACSEDRIFGIETVQNKPYNSLLFVAPLVLSTPPVGTVAFGPCHEEFGMPDYRRADCDLYYRLRGQTSPWKLTAARADAMHYGPGELQCWRTLGTAECIPIAGPPRPVNMVAPNMGAN